MRKPMVVYVNIACSSCGCTHPSVKFHDDLKSALCIDCAAEIELANDASDNVECCPTGCRRCLPDA